MPPKYKIKFPYSAIRFDFDHGGSGEAWVIDRLGHSAKLKIEVEYPLSADPTFHNVVVTHARLIKGWSGFDLSPRVVKFIREKDNVELG